MAFHPMRTFQKHRKFWMASILLVCMATFVLCTGMQGGDFGDWLMRLLGGRGGQVLVTIDNRDYYPRDFDQIRKKRDIANEIMRKATMVNIDRLGRAMEEVANRSDARERERLMFLYTTLVTDLSERMNRPRYFEGGTKFDEIVDFILWRNQAERLGINLGIDGLRELIQLDVHGRPGTELAGLMLDANTMRNIHYDVRGSIYEATDSLIEEALMDEYRVRIAQLALAEVQWKQFQTSSGNFRLRFDPGEWGLVTRKIITPEQFREFYKKNRSEMEVALVPLRLDELAKKVAAPTAEDLKKFFEKYRDARYNPESETPGFERPAEVSIEWISADPDMPFYKKAAAAALAAEIVAPPLGLAGPSASPLTSGVGFLGKQLAWEALLHRMYSNIKNIPSQAVKYEIPGWLQTEVAMALVSRKPPDATEVAALVGSVANPDFVPGALMGFQRGAYLRQEKTLAPLLEQERKTRAAVGATLILSATMDSPSGLAPVGVPLAQAVYATQKQFLPLNDEVRADLRQRFERAFYAQRWVNKNMIAARDRLNAKQENATDIYNAVKDLTRDGRFEHGLSTRTYNQYEIENDPALKPLRDSWRKLYSQINTAEGRAGTTSMLREDDFYKMFFEGEPFSAAASNLYTPKVWPPQLQPRPQPHLPAHMQKAHQDRIARNYDRFETAEKPFLFWRTRSIPARTPRSFDETEQVRQAVEKAYRLAEARKIIGPLLSKGGDALAAALKKEYDDPRQRGALYDAVRELARAQGGEPVKLHHIAPLVPKPAEATGELQYGPYELPRGAIPYPTAETAKQLLALNDLKAAIKVDHPEIDRINEELFKNKVGGRAVQVLTNKPRTEFYLAVVVTPPVDLGDFEGLHRAMLGVRGNLVDLIMDQAQREAGQEYRRELMAQLRQNVTIHEAGEQELKNEQKQEQKKR